MTSLFCILYSLLFFASILFPVQAQNTWIYPKPFTNPTFSSEDILEAAWASDYSNPTLLLLCDFPGPPSLNESVKSTGAYLVPLDYGNGLYACHLNLAETTINGRSLDSANFNIRPNHADTPITWDSKSDSGPTTTTVSATTSAPTTTTVSTSTSAPTITAISTSTSTPALTITRIAISTITTGPAISPNAAVKSATSNTPVSPLPSTTSSQNQSKNPSVGIIVGATIAALIGIVSLIVAILLYFRTRSRHKSEATQSPQNQAPDKYGGHQNCSELTGLSMAVESGGREIVNRELSGYPVAVGQRSAVGELEGRGRG